MTEGYTRSEFLDFVIGALLVVVVILFFTLGGAGLFRSPSGSSNLPEAPPATSR